MKKCTKKIKKLLAAIIVIAAAAAVIILPQIVTKTVSGSLAVSSHIGDNRPVYAAHRGLSSLYPQNTIPAFEAAKKEGFYAFEFDIHTTADGKWVVIHNDTVDAMTDGKGEVESFTLDEIKKLNIDAGNGIENYSGLKIPTLEETLDVCKESDIIPIIEIKKCDIAYIPDFMNTLKERGLTEKAVIISFDFDYLKEVRKLDADIKMMYLVNEVTKDTVDMCVENGNIGIDFGKKKMLSGIGAVKYAKEMGLEIGAWTVDDTITADFLAAIGVNIITTNRIIP